MTRLDKRTLKRILREELESLLDGKITQVQYGTWEGSGTVAEWADLDSFYLNGKKTTTVQNDNFSVDFTIDNQFYNIKSIATIENQK